jgi:hypothetical protein
MAEQAMRMETANASAGNKPALIAYSVKLNEDQAVWTRIGAARAHKKGPGFSIQLDALPLEGRIVLVAPAVDPKAAANEA